MRERLFLTSSVSMTSYFFFIAVLQFCAILGGTEPWLRFVKIPAELGEILAARWVRTPVGDCCLLVR